MVAPAPPRIVVPAACSSRGGRLAGTTTRGAHRYEPDRCLCATDVSVGLRTAAARALSSRVSVPLPSCRKLPARCSGSAHFSFLCYSSPRAEVGVGAGKKHTRRGHVDARGSLHTPHTVPQAM